MPVSHAESKARVRTRTGCLQCEQQLVLIRGLRPLTPKPGRQRRKKCDEYRPECRRCISNGVTCIWPTMINQPIDGRLREARRWKSQLSASIDEYHWLYAHFATTVLPRLTRPTCPAEYVDHSYMLHLAHGFPPLMTIMVAIAAADLGRRELAMDRYLCSLRTLQHSLADAADAGNEDGLLATTIFLCVFEVSLSNSPSALRRSRG